MRMKMGENSPFFAFVAGEKKKYSLKIDKSACHTEIRQVDNII